MVQLIDEQQLDAFRNRCQTILDVRSPKEFEEDHIPGAINIPALTNTERAEVGTLYRKNPFLARKVGAGFVLQKIREFIASPLIQEAHQSHAFLLYCARGGQRSDALATVLSQIGFPVFRLVAGYKTYRAYIEAWLNRTMPQPIIVLHGYTGSRKTTMLHQCDALANVLDLEGTANHRGSVLGEFANQVQPSQKRFETLLVQTLQQFIPGRPTLVEGESRTIGKSRIPDQLWRQIRGGQCLWLDLPRHLRRQHILQDYADLKNPDHLAPKLENLKPFIPGSIFSDIKKAMSDSDWETLVDLLLIYHYDPLYERAKKRASYQEISAQTMEEAYDRLRGILAQNCGIKTAGQKPIPANG